MAKKNLTECDFCGKEIKGDDYFTLKSQKNNKEKDMCPTCYEKLMKNKQIFKATDFVSNW